MARRGKGEGNVYQRADGRWEARVTLGRDESGRRLRKVAYGPTRREAGEALNRLLGRVQNGEQLVTSTPTLANWLNTWYAAHKREWRPITRRIYRTAIDQWLAPLGTTRLEKLKPAQVQQWITSLVEDQPRAYVITAHVVLRGALKFAMRQQLVTFNVATMVNVPRPKGAPITPFSADEARQIFQAAEGDRLSALFVVALSLGLRIGEVTGLRWSDVDLSAGTVAISVQLQPVRPENGPKGGPQALKLVELKTEAAHRTLTLPTLTLDALKAHRTRQLEERLKAGAAWTNSLDLVFTQSDGAPLTPGAVRSVFRRLLKSAGLDLRRFHNTRHTCATLLLEAGTPLVEVSKSLGHAKLSITADTYSHWTPTMAQGVAAKMDAVLKTGSGSSGRQ